VLLPIEKNYFKKCDSKTNKPVIVRSNCKMEMWIGRGVLKFSKTTHTGLAWFQASVAVQMSSSLFWDVTST